MKFFALLIASVAAVQVSRLDVVAAEAEHKYTMGLADGIEAKRSADVAAQASSDQWRNNGEKTPWVPNNNINKVRAY